MVGNRFKTFILLSVLAALFIGFGSLVGGKIGMVVGLLLAMLINFGSYWFSDKIVLKLYKAKRVSPEHRLYKIVRELSHIAKIPMPKVYIIQAHFPNAFATGRSPKHSAVAATESLLNLLTDDEIKGVMAHELSHIKHRDTLIQTIAVGIASAIAFIAEMFQWLAIFGFGRDKDNNISGLIGILVLAILTPIIASLIQLAISRQREFLADAGAVKIMRSPQPLINALLKLEHSTSHIKTRPNSSYAPTESLFIINPFKNSSIFELFSTHPSTKTRIEAMKKIKLR